MSVARLRHGIFMAPYHPVDENPTTLFQKDIELIEWADKLGFDEAWVGEHHSMGWETISSPELFLAYAAARTSRITLGTGVVSLPYHNPFMVANRIIQLDHMTKGRIKFGVGPGLLVQDAKMMGIDPKETRDRMIDSLEIIMRLFRGEKITKKTEWYDLQEAYCQILPYSKPYPEICVASTLTPSGGRLAGKYDLGMLCFATDHGSYSALKKNWEIACEIAQENNRKMDPGRLRLVGPMHIAETKELAREQVRAGLAKHIDYQLRVVPDRYQIPVGVDPVDWYIDTEKGLVGTPDDAIKMLQSLQAHQGDFGAYLITATDWADWEQQKKSLELYMRFVVPKIDNSNAKRVESLDLTAANWKEYNRLRKEAAQIMIDRHESERAGAAS